MATWREFRPSSALTEQVISGSIEASAHVALRPRLKLNAAVASKHDGLNTENREVPTER